MIAARCAGIRQDIPLLFRKFAADVAAQYAYACRDAPMPRRARCCDIITGAVRQLKNGVEQYLAIEQTAFITADVLSCYLPPQDEGRPHDGRDARGRHDVHRNANFTYKVLFDTMRADINDLKRMMSELMHTTLQAPCGPVHDVKALPATTAPEFRYRPMPRARR